MNARKYQSRQVNKSYSITLRLIPIILLLLLLACSVIRYPLSSSRALTMIPPEITTTPSHDVEISTLTSRILVASPTAMMDSLPTLAPTISAIQTPDDEGVRISQLCNGEYAPVGIIPGGIWLLGKSNQDGLWMTKRDVSSAKRIVEAGDMDTLRLSLDYSNLVITNFNTKPRQFTVMSSDGENIRTFDWKDEWPLDPNPLGIISWYPNMFLRLSGNLDYDTGYGDFYFISPYTGEVYKQISDNLFFANINGDLTRMVRGEEAGLDLINIDRNIKLKKLKWLDSSLSRGLGHYWSRDGQLFIYYDSSSNMLFNIVVIDNDGNELYRTRFQSVFNRFIIYVFWTEMSPSHEFMAFWAKGSRFNEAPDQEIYRLYVYDFTNQYLYDYCIFHEDPSYPEIIWSPDSQYVVAVDQQGVGFYLDIHSGNIWWFPKEIILKGWSK